MFKRRRFPVENHPGVCSLVFASTGSAIAILLCWDCEWEVVWLVVRQNASTAIERLTLMTFVATVPGLAIQPEASWTRSRSLNSIGVPGAIRTRVNAVKETDQLATITHC
jgi:hypothetical protein